MIWVWFCPLVVIPHEKAREHFPKLRFNPIPPKLSAPRRVVTAEEKAAKKAAKAEKRKAAQNPVKRFQELEKLRQKIAAEKKAKKTHKKPTTAPKKEEQKKEAK